MIKHDTLKTLVSIIMPSFNSEKHIFNAIQSVINQIYTNWELIIIDDYSSDNSISIIKDFISRDSRIKLIELLKNSGPANARNIGVLNSMGEFMAFIDSDDLWLPEKLSKQISYMISNNFTFTCTGYNKINDLGKSLNHHVIPKSSYSYNQLLLSCPGNSTVVYNAKELGKFYIPNIKKRNDYLLWLQVIKKAKKIYSIPEILSSHRIRINSLSRNKIDLLKYHWKIYRKNEKLNFFFSSFLILFWVLKGFYSIISMIINNTHLIKK
jgi:teichuronic acid biosynthesis glycosyltransferase TuaG